MACGVPVVATRQGGLPEVVVDGETGYLAAVGAVDEMTERALAVLQDGATHERMRRAAAARALEFSTERVVPRYEALYQEDRKSTRLNSSHSQISYAVFCLKKKKKK